MASIQSNLAKYFVRQLRQQSLKYLSDIKILRVEQDKALSRIRPPRNVRFASVSIANISAEWAIPSLEGHRHPDRVILYFHGGGYAVGSAYSHRGLVGKLAAEVGISILSIDYRLAPEHPFPAGLEDALQSYLWLLNAKGYAPEQIIVMGDSAGGGLGLSTLLKIKESGLPQPLTAVFISPWTDLSFSGDSIHTHQDRDPLLLSDQAHKWAKWYYTHHEPTHPLISPLFGDYTDITPIFIQVGTDEILLSDSLRMIEVAKKYKASIKVNIWDSMMHVWHFGWPYVPEGRKAIQEIAQYLQDAIAGDQVQKRPVINPLTAPDPSKLNEENSWLKYGSDILKNLWGSE